MERIAQQQDLRPANVAAFDADVAVWRETQKTIESVTASYEKVYSLNTVVSDLMILTNTISSHFPTASPDVLRAALSALIRMAAPITPAFGEECWSLLHPGAGSVFGGARFPVTDGTLSRLQPRKQNCAVQVNGKLKVVVEISPAPIGMEGNELTEWVVGEVMKTPEGKAKLADMLPAKTVKVVRRGTLVNFVV
jgi:leucyl-tRNA synthetase